MVLAGRQHRRPKYPIRRPIAMDDGLGVSRVRVEVLQRTGLARALQRAPELIADGGPQRASVYPGLMPFWHAFVLNCHSAISFGQTIAGTPAR